MILVCSQVWVQKPEDNFRACFSLSTIGSGDQTQVIWLEWQVPLLPESSCWPSRSSYALRCWIPPISSEPSARAPNWPRLLCLQPRLLHSPHSSFSPSFLTASSLTRIIYCLRPLVLTQCCCVQFVHRL